MTLATVKSDVGQVKAVTIPATHKAKGMAVTKLETPKAGQFTVKTRDLSSFPVLSHKLM